MQNYKSAIRKEKKKNYNSSSFKRKIDSTYVFPCGHCVVTVWSLCGHCVVTVWPRKASHSGRFQRLLRSNSLTLGGKPPLRGTTRAPSARPPFGTFVRRLAVAQRWPPAPQLADFCWGEIPSPWNHARAKRAFSIWNLCTVACGGAALASDAGAPGRATLVAGCQKTQLHLRRASHSNYQTSASKT